MTEITKESFKRILRDKPITITLGVIRELFRPKEEIIDYLVDPLSNEELTFALRDYGWDYEIVDESEDIECMICGAILGKGHGCVCRLVCEDCHDALEQDYIEITRSRKDE